MKNSKRIANEIESWEFVLNKIKLKYSTMYDMAKLSFFNVHLNIFNQIIHIEHYKQIPEYKKILKTIRKNYKFFMNSNDYNINGKISLTALKINVRLYKLFVLIVNFKNRNKSIKNILFD